MKKFLTILLLICAVCTGYAQNNTTKADKKAAKEMRAEAKKALNSKKVENPNDKAKAAPAPKVEKVKAEPKQKPAKVKTAPAPKAEKVKTTPAPKVEKVKAEPKQKPAKVKTAPAPKAEKVKTTPAPKAEKVKAEPKQKPAKVKTTPAPKAEKVKTVPAPKVEKVKAEPKQKPAKVKTTPAPKVEKVKTTPAPKVEKVKAEPKQKPAKVQKAAKVEVNALPKVKNEPKAKSEPKVKNEAKAKSEPKVKSEPKAKVPRAPRIDRQINSNKFVFKGESMMGLTVSYGTVDSEDSDIGLIIDNIDLNGQMFTIKPHYGFFYRDNNAIGVRLGYSYTNGNLGNAGLNLGEANDISLSLGGLGYSSRGYTAAIYHRSYMSIDRKGRFGLFAEWELSGGFSESRFDFSSGESVTSNVAHSYNAAISFAPGIAVYIFPNVCASLSFGMGGLQYKHIKQMDAEGNFTGQRDFSKLRFGLNLAQINIGVNIHLWNKKKDK
ncbi:MAG: hypothetical protein II986_08365 [Alistipes sp.]|nr:hypothetical protein [Alistipes sp.]